MRPAHPDTAAQDWSSWWTSSDLHRLPDEAERHRFITAICALEARPS
jgi:hypothetical protein